MSLASFGRWAGLGIAMGMFSGGLSEAQGAEPPPQYLLINVAVTEMADALPRIAREFPSPRPARLRVGVGCIFSYFGRAKDQVESQLRTFLGTALAHDLPVLVALDGEYWLEGRPDLWNWWSPDRPGYDPANRELVEWSSWDSADALKIAWLNWGRQIRVLPPQNLMHPRYRAACYEEMRRLVPIVLEWARSLPPEKKDLFVGLKIGWESSIGVNKFYYPKDENHARTGALFCAAIRVLPVFIFVLPGLLFHGILQRGLLPGVQVANSKEVYGVMIHSLLPAGLFGVMAAALMAALMGNLASAANSISTLFSYDLWKRFRPELPQALRLVRAFPEVHFILDHCVNPEIRQRATEPWKSSLAALAREPNVDCKLSGLVICDIGVARRHAPL